MAVVDRREHELDEMAVRARARRVGLLVVAVVGLLFLLPFAWKLWL